MKIAIPLAQRKLCMHFGHCEEFAVVDADADAKSVLNVDYITPPEHQPGLLPRWLNEKGVNVVIAGGMGARAQGLFAEAGVKVVVGAPSESPETIVESYLGGTLAAGANVCDH